MNKFITAGISGAIFGIAYLAFQQFTGFNPDTLANKIQSKIRGKI